MLGGAEGEVLNQPTVNDAQLRFPLSHRGEYTSQTAANEARRTMATLRGRIYDLALEQGSLTPWEACDLMHLEDSMIYILRPRFTELRCEGLLLKTNDVRRGGPYDKMERIWRPVSQ